jgi:cytochrome c biogenesis protein CcmG/thiol:disulfide interchange protein DsbE
VTDVEARTGSDGGDRPDDSGDPTSPAGGPPRRSHTALIIAGVVALVAVLLVVLLATSPQGDSDQQTSSPVLGRLAPDIKASDTSGGQFRIDDYRGRWVLVNFFATWCGPCKVEHPELVKFAQRHELTGDAAVVSVAFNESPKVVKQFFEQNGGDWPVIAQGNGEFAIDYGVIKLPESYLIAPDGTVVEKFVGGIRADDVDAEIARLSGGSNGSSK